MAMRREHRGAARAQARRNRILPRPKQTGKLVFEAEGRVAFGDKVVIRDFSDRIMRGDRIGIVGPNGAGKSTLIRMLLGELRADAGPRGARHQLEVAYYDQQREQLDLDAHGGGQRSATAATRGGRRREPARVMATCRTSCSAPTSTGRPRSALSGGERNRLLLARLFTRPANLLVLDEPTNDLDIDTLELLEELVAEFPGTLLLVSHDRAFLDNVVTSLLVLEGDGRVQEFVGGSGDPAFYSGAQDAVRATLARLETIGGEIDAAYERWAALEALRAG
jgi:ABC transport system ATP-binding/permease protein